MYYFLCKKKKKKSCEFESDMWMSENEDFPEGDADTMWPPQPTWRNNNSTHNKWHKSLPFIELIH